MTKIIGILLGFFTFYIPLMIYRYFIVDNTQTSKLFEIDLLNIHSLLNRIESIFFGLRNVGYLFFGHFGNDIPKWLGWLAFIYFLLLITFMLFLYLKKSKSIDENQLQLLDLIRIVLSINIALIVFLSLINLVSYIEFSYLGLPRYNIILFPSLLVSCFAVFYYPLRNLKNIYFKIIKIISGIFLAFFLVGSLNFFHAHPYNFFGFLYFDNNTDLIDYPSRKILTRDPSSYQKLIRLLENKPSSIAISWASDFDFTHALNKNIRRRIFQGPGRAFKGEVLKYERGNYSTTQTLKAYLIFNIDKSCPSYCYYNLKQEVNFLKSLPDVKTVYLNKKEKIQILYVTIPKGPIFSI